MQLLHKVVWIRVLRTETYLKEYYLLDRVMAEARYFYLVAAPLACRILVFSKPFSKRNYYRESSQVQVPEVSCVPRCVPGRMRRSRSLLKSFRMGILRFSRIPAVKMVSGVTCDGC